MVMRKYVLVINPGSTSTKLALYLYTEKRCVLSYNLSHNADDLKKFDKIYLQKDMRTNLILEWLKNNNISLDELKAVVGRGGLLRSMPGGTYKVTKPMLHDLKIGIQGQHASNLGGIIAQTIAEKSGVEAYIVDPVAVDEILDIARISGMPEIPRRSLVHALNIKSVVRKVCENYNKSFYNSSYVVAHLGGGISISPVKNGKILDCNNASEEGPFSTDRCAGLPVGDVVKIAFSGKYTEKQMRKKIIGNGGLMSYLGTNDARIVDKMIDDGDKKAELVLKAMAYQIGKEIGAMATVIKGRIDGVILTGGLSKDKKITDCIIKMVEFIAPVIIMPGEFEMQALFEGALRVINKEEEAKIYENEVYMND